MIEGPNGEKLDLLRRVNLQRANRDGVWAGLVLGAIIGALCAGELSEILAHLWRAISEIAGRI